MTTKPANAAKFEQMIEDFNDIVEQTYYYEQKIYEWTKKVEANKIRISKEMGRKNSQTVKVDEQTVFGVNKKVETSIEFFEDQIAKNVDKEIYNKVVTKTVVIENLFGLIKLMKRYGVDPTEFKNYIKTIKKVDVEVLDQLIEIGEIEIKDLQGCYKAEFTEDIRVKKISR